LFRGGLGEEDDHLLGAPALKVEHEGECDEVVDAERACEAPVGETLSPSLFLMLDHLGEGQLHLHDGRVVTSAPVPTSCTVLSDGPWTCT